MADDDFTPPSETPADLFSDGASAPDTPDGAPAKKAAKKAPAKKAAKKAPAKKAAAKKAAKKAPAKAAEGAGEGAEEAPAKKTAAKKSASMKADKPVSADQGADETADQGPGTMLLFKAPEPTKVTSRPARARKVVATEPTDEVSESGDEPAAKAPAKKAAAKKTAAKKTAAKKTADKPSGKQTDDDDSATESAESADGDDFTEGGEGGSRRRRRRGGRRRRKPGDGEGGGDDNESGPSDSGDGESGDGDGEGTSRRRRRRTREGDDRSGGGDDPQNTVTRVRKPRSAEDEITAIAGSTRLEAKKQRRREGREAGRRRAPIVSEAEFLARRESVDRVMVIRQRDDLTQIGVLEDKVLVEHYVARESQTSLIGNVYLGRVQNVLPSMEAAFIDIGKGRNAVLYAGEVNWSALGHKDGAPRKIESVLSSGQTILVQVTKDPVGHKGARLTSQVSLAGRFLVYVPDGTTSGISRKLPDTERNRLKSLLKEIVPDTAGVIVRTAAEGASEEELTRDVERLKARWDDIEAKTKGQSPKLLYGEPDLTLKVVRDLFTEDFARLVIQGDDAWESVTDYVKSIAPDLEGRLEKYDGEPERHLRVVPGRRADRQGARPQGLAALGRLADHRPHRGHDRGRRQHRQVHRLRGQPRGDGHQEQPGGCRGGRAPAPAARHRRHHRHRLHRHGAGVQPRPRAPADGRVPRPRPHPPPGRGGHLPRAGADDPQADRHRPARGLQRELPPLPGSWPDAARHAGRGQGR